MIDVQQRLTLEQAFAKGLLHAQLAGCTGFDRIAFAATYSARLMRMERERTEANARSELRREQSDEIFTRGG